ncbi:MAG: hypothetical protein WKF30_13060 [Pyrinomonadaceae bacterium]
MIGDPAQAIIHFGHALRIDPAHADARDNLQSVQPQLNNPN